MREIITVIVTNIIVAVLIIGALIGSRWCEEPQQQEQASEPPADEIADRQTEVIELIIIEDVISEAEARLRRLYRKSEEHVDGEG